MSTASALGTPVTSVLRPVRIQSEPSWCAIVVMLCELLPASGSVMPKATMVLPSAMPGSHRVRCSGVPYLARTVPTMAGETTIMMSGAPSALTSSSTRESS